MCASDLEKGFDRVFHHFLIEKMTNDNFDNFIVSFMINYLMNRTQRVKWKNKSSNAKLVVSGISQGSSFGPLIVDYFIYDLVLPSDHEIFMIKYADDVTICTPILKKNCGYPSFEFSCLHF